jgi:putative ABC transport system permease protein
MFRHNLLLIYRNFKLFKVSFLINLIGLSTGLICTLLIYLWINDELRIDSNNQNDELLYQVMKNETAGDGIQTEAFMPGMLAREIKKTIPKVSNSVAVVPPSSVYTGILSNGTSFLYATPQFVDQEYFKVFACEMIAGNKDKMLINNNAVSISEEMAIKLFNTTKNVVGKTLKFENEYVNGQFLITGIFNSEPRASAKFDILFSYNLFLERRPEIREWNNGGPSTYVVLEKGASIDQVNTNLSRLLQIKRSGTQEQLFLQRYSERYLYNKYENGKPIGGRIVYIRLFFLIAVFIMGIASINFMNLSTARASRRLKEIGVKKVMGAQRRSLMLQFLGEALFLSLLSTPFALIVVELLLPEFNEITGKQLVLTFDWNFTIVLLTIAGVTGLLSGSYPALYLSDFNPASALKGHLPNTTHERLIRKGLVVFQFVVSMLLIVSVIVIYKQIQFIQTKDLGYDQEHILSIPKNGNLEKNYDTFRTELKKEPGVVNVSFMFGNLAGGISSRSGGFSWSSQSPDRTATKFNYLDIDFDLIETLGLQLKSGRSFSRNFGSDSSAIVFNEAAIKTMGISDPVGKTVEFYGKKQIIGVVKDFHFESLFEKVKPFFFKIDREKGGNILIRIKSEAETTTLKNIQLLFNKFNKGTPFEYRFLVRDDQEQYISEQRLAILSRYFASIAVLISGLGLLGLAIFTVENRLKEIAIRTTLGCSKSGIAYLLSKDFLKTMMLSILVAFPLSYILSKNWLDGFAYKIHLNPLIFLTAGLISLLMVALAVGMQIYNVYKMNPAKTLKQ